MPASPLTVAHLKDRFLPASEAFVYKQLDGLTCCRALVLDRYRQQNQAQFPLEAHFSPAVRYGSAYALVERLLLRTAGRSPYLERVLRQQGVQVIHAHFGQLAALFVPVARRHRIPLITSFYGKDVSVFAKDPAWQRRFQALWQYGHTFLALGPRMAQRLVELGCPAGRVQIMPLAIDVQQFDFAPLVPPPAGEPVQLLSAGRLIPKKGMDILLHALAQPPAANCPFHLTIVGEGPERPRLEQLVAELGLSGRVTFAGWVTHEALVPLMQQAHLFILASRTDPQSGEEEGTPTVLLEAQACGRPVASTRHSDIPAIVAHELHHLLAPEGDPAALSTVLSNFFAHPEQWPGWGRTARRWVETHNERPVVQQRLAQVYAAAASS